MADEDKDVIALAQLMEPLTKLKLSWPLRSLAEQLIRTGVEGA